jgi:predicted phosphoribosyltransferase
VSVAVPVGPPGTSQRFSSRCDAFTCLYEPGDFSSVGQYYADFSPVEDAEAANILRAFSHLT